MAMAGRQPAPACRDPAAPLTQVEPGSPRDQLTNNLVGHFNGFSIRPMKAEEAGETAGPPPKPPPPSAPPAEHRRVCEVKPTVLRPPQPQDVPRTTFGGLKGRTEKTEPRRPGSDKPPPPPPPPPQGARTTFDMKPAVEKVEKVDNVEKVVDSVPEPPPPEPPRPVVPSAAAVSSRTTFGMAAPAPRKPTAEVKHREEPPEPAKPSEARTTFTARSSAKPGDRPPPPPRPTAAVGPAAASAPVSPTAPLPAAAVAGTRPLSVVNPLESVPDARSYTLRSDTSRSSTLDSNRSAGSDRTESPFGSALSRMSGIFRRGDKATPGSPEPDRGMHPNQSFKAAKIDRDRLKSLEISAPIPQSVTVPESAVPLQSAAGASRPPPLPTSPPGRRAAAGRPAAPPPRPPPTRAAIPAPVAVSPVEEVYDDCNLETPTACDPAGGGENIYSTIDESPGRHDHLYATPPEETPTADGDDLLSEIAAELRSTDTTLYAAVNKNRRRDPPQAPDAVYQNVEDVQEDDGPPSYAKATETANRSGDGGRPAPPLKKSFAPGPTQKYGRARGAPPALPKKPEPRRPPFK